MELGLELVILHEYFVAGGLEEEEELGDLRPENEPERFFKLPEVVFVIEGDFSGGHAEQEPVDKFLDSFLHDADPLV